MEFRTGSDVRFEIPTEWWERAGMPGFARRALHYTVTDTERVRVVPIAEVVAPKRMSNLQGYSRDGFDQDRMISVLSAFTTGAPLPPVEVTENVSGPARYTLYDGMHRFYASIAARYSHLPIIITEDPQAFLDAERAEAQAWSQSQARHGGAPDS